METKSRAPWQAAPPPLKGRVSVPSMAAVQSHALFQAAPTGWSGSSKLASRTVGMVAVHFQSAAAGSAAGSAAGTAVPSLPNEERIPCTEVLQKLRMDQL